MASTLFLTLTLSLGFLVSSAAGYPSSADSPSTNQISRYAKKHPNSKHYSAQTLHGITYPSLTASQAIGTQGHILLQDAFLLEKLQSFNRERIPERVVHAKGAGAFGHFQVTNDISAYTMAKFLQPGEKTNVAVRFSTVGGESGTPDTQVDPKGFATKFYTKEGIHDLVGNNIQVFPIRDPMLFADINRARKRNPQTHLGDATMWWDFTALRPETTLHTLHLFSDMGTPRSYRYVDGAGVHTFKMVNSSGTPVYVKFHWKSEQKVEEEKRNRTYFTPEESVEVAGTSPDVLLKDLFDSIEMKEFPSWNLFIQVMTFPQAEKHKQNPFDVTKFWRPEEYPLIAVGKMTLDRNHLDYFTEIEQLAFSPSHMVPGIEASPDRMLHARIFSYPDSQLYRLGANFAQIPVNRCPFQLRSYERDGAMNVQGNGKGEPNYYPNSFNGLDSSGDVSGRQSKFPVSGDVDRVDTGGDDQDNFSMARIYLESYVGAEERKRIPKNIAAFLRKADLLVQNNFLQNIAYKITKEFGDELKTALGI